MSDKKIELINQLLAKAESTTPEEAEALTEHAERLMIKYGIEQAQLEAKKGKPTEQIVQERLEFTGAYRGEMINLGAAVCNALGALRVLQNTGANRGKTFVLYVIGFESDVRQAITLIQSLQVQSAVAVRAWWKANKEEHAWKSSYDQEKVRRSFVHGFGTGAGSRIRATRATVVEESSKGTDLVLASRDTKVQEHFDSLATRKGRARTATGRDGAAADGYRAGQNANTGGQAVGQGRGIGA
ncbi:hypothetical protein SEA_ANDROMEDAS_56 [Microbacterium phage Andromedas]|uniref:DUF2786 domain-containing protein n=3 Tax=Elerivirus eleri TaxID=2560589 RepID=A0A6N0A669_9CAUD|nr:hypothetical protein SEA_COLACORTA_56 [Microbacterium phage ColaCorta]AXH70734.1 hypothetical protein SEA_ANDROMEDAS_56 [Microbacterium phage Andromedas]QKO02683.1 hypothetical protein SEA_GLAMOUR_55 [Microbacterium phage Glamour]